jgi:hypothetical protein
MIAQFFAAAVARFSELSALQLPHWLTIAGTLLVIAGLIGFVSCPKQLAKIQVEPATDPSGPEPRAQLPPLPDLLDSRPRKNRRSMLGDEEHRPGPPPEKPTSGA